MSQNKLQNQNKWGWSGKYMTNLEAYKEIIKEYVKETGELTCAVA